MNKDFFRAIGINDLWLTVFFAVLAVNMFIGMVFPLSSIAEKAGIDIATRTATAVLAGYFISKGFTEKKPALPARESGMRKKFQSYIVASLGLVSLVILIVVRYADGIGFSPATVSQVRDLYLASVAFLMGTA